MAQATPATPNPNDVTALQARITELEKEVRGKDIAFQNVAQQRDQVQQQVGAIQREYEAYQTKVQEQVDDMVKRPLHFAEQFTALARQQGQTPGLNIGGDSGNGAVEPDPGGPALRNLHQTVQKQGESWTEYQRRLGQIEQQLAQTNQMLLQEREMRLRTMLTQRAERDLSGFKFKSEAAKQRILDSVIQNLKTGQSTYEQELAFVRDNFTTKDEPAPTSTGPQSPPVVAAGSPLSGPALGGTPAPEPKVETEEEVSQFMDRARKDVADLFSNFKADDYGDPVMSS